MMIGSNYFQKKQEALDDITKDFPTLLKSKDELMEKAIAATELLNEKKIATQCKYIIKDNILTIYLDTDEGVIISLPLDKYYVIEISQDSAICFKFAGDSYRYYTKTENKKILEEITDLIFSEKFKEEI